MRRLAHVSWLLRSVALLRGALVWILIEVHILRWPSDSVLLDMILLLVRNGRILIISHLRVVSRGKVLRMILLQSLLSRSWLVAAIEIKVQNLFVLRWPSNSFVLDLIVLSTPLVRVLVDQHLVLRLLNPRALLA